MRDARMLAELKVLGDEMAKLGGKPPDMVVEAEQVRVCI
jgi:hypothetical protein